jgi:ATP-dependent DNA helicase RecG
VKEQLLKLGLSNRQLKAVAYVREKGSISNSEFQSLNNISKATASLWAQTAL